MARLLRLMFVRLAGWMALLARSSRVNGISGSFSASTSIATTSLTCNSGAGIDRESQADQRRDIRLVGPDQLFADQGPSAQDAPSQPSA
jgi:hypothetical protein